MDDLGQLIIFFMCAALSFATVQQTSAETAGRRSTGHSLQQHRVSAVYN